MQTIQEILFHKLHLILLIKNLPIVKQLLNIVRKWPIHYSKLFTNSHQVSRHLVNSLKIASKNKIPNNLIIPQKLVIQTQMQISIFPMEVGSALNVKTTIFMEELSVTGVKSWRLSLIIMVNPNIFWRKELVNRKMVNNKNNKPLRMKWAHCSNN